MPYRWDSMLNLMVFIYSFWFKQSKWEKWLYVHILYTLVSLNVVVLAYFNVFIWKKSFFREAFVINMYKIVSFRLNLLSLCNRSNFNLLFLSSAFYREKIMLLWLSVLCQWFLCTPSEKLQFQAELKTKLILQFTRFGEEKRNLLQF